MAGGGSSATAEVLNRRRRRLLATVTRKTGNSHLVLTVVELDGVRLRALIDSGYAGHCVVSRAVLAPDLQLEPSRTMLRPLGGGTLPVVGQLARPFVMAGVLSDGRQATAAFPTTLTVVDRPFAAPFQAIIGSGWLRSRRVCVDYNAEEVRFTDGFRVPFVEAPELTKPLLGSVRVHECRRDAASWPVLGADDDGSTLAVLTASRLSAVARPTGLAVGAPDRAVNLDGQAQRRARKAAAAVDHEPTTSDSPEEVVRRMRQQQEAGEREDAMRTAEEDLAQCCARVEGELGRLARLAAEVADSREQVASHRVVGDTEYMALTPELRDQVLDILVAMTKQFAHPRKAPRNADAMDLGTRLVLELMPEAVGLPPVRDGLARRFSPEKVAEIVRQVRQLELCGLVERASSRAWASGVVLAKKKNGAWRFCVDFTRLNQRTRPDEYALPDMASTLREVASEGCFFSTIDLTDAFYHLGVDVESRPLTGFEVPTLGRFQWKCMPMGVRDAPGLFQRVMEQVFRPLLGRGVRIFIDDLVVYSRDEKSHVQLLKKVVAIMRAYDLRVNFDKTNLLRTSVRLLGRIVSANSISVDPDSTKALREYELPSDVTSLRRFIGLFNYHADFVPHAADVLRPLFALEKEARERANEGAATIRMRANDATPLIWSGEAREAFCRCKAALVDMVTLHMPRPDEMRRPGCLVLETDATTAAGGDGVTRRPATIAAALYFVGVDGARRLVGVHSRACRPAEQRYAACEVEMLAIVEGVRHFAWAGAMAGGLLCRTDHQALTFLPRLAVAGQGRLARWAALLIESGVKVDYRPGRENSVADALSRAVAAAVPSGTPFASVMANGSLMQRLAAVDAVALDFEEQLSELPSGEFAWAVVDWPWLYDDSSAKWFRRQPLDRWRALDLERLMAPSAAVVVCAPGAKVQEVVEAMRQFPSFRLLQTWCWVKSEAVPRQVAARALPSVPAEYFLVYSRGDRRAVFRESADVGVLRARPREPGRKPEQLYRLIEAIAAPGCARLDIFARQSRPGWTPVGDEASKFDVAQAFTLAALDVAVECRSSTAPLWAQSHGYQAVVFEALEPRAQDIWRRDVGAPPTPLLKDRMDTLCRSIGGRRQVSMDEVQIEQLLAFRGQTRSEFDPVVFVLARDGEVERAVQLSKLKRSSRPCRLVVPAVQLLLDERQEPPPVWIPREARGFWTPLIMTLHAEVLTHAGHTRVVEKVRATGYYAGRMEALVRDVLSKCLACQQQKGGQRAWRPISTVRPTGGLAAPSLFAAVHLDFFEVDRPSADGHVAILTISDAFSRRRVLQAVKDMTEETVARVLVDHWIRPFGWPLQLSSDQGTQFTAKVVAAALRAAGVHQVLTTAYHPQANGVDERVHRTLKSWVALAMREAGLAGDEWHRVLPAVELVLNTTRHRATGFAPSFVCFGVVPLLPADLVTTTAKEAMRKGLLQAEWLPTRAGAEAGGVIKSLHKIRLDVWDRLLRSAEKAEWATTSAHTSSAEAEGPGGVVYRPGDYVWVYEPEALQRDMDEFTPLKFQATKWSGPWRVLACVRRVALLLTKASDPVVARSVSVLRTKKAHLQHDVRESYEALFEELDMRDKEVRERVERSRARAVEWSDGNEEERYVVTKVLRVFRRRGGRRGSRKGDDRMVQVQWEDGSKSVEPFDAIYQDIPQMIDKWLKDHSMAEGPAK